MPTDLNYPRIRGAVPVIGIFHGTHLVSMETVQGLFSGISGLTARRDALNFGPDQQCLSFHDHPALLTFLGESSLGGFDPTLLFCLNYKGVSDSLQPTIERQEERGTAWKFEAIIDAAHHAEFIDE